MIELIIYEIIIARWELNISFPIIINESERTKYNNWKTISYLGKLPINNTGLKLATINLILTITDNILIIGIACVHFSPNITGTKMSERNKVPVKSNIEIIENTFRYLLNVSL